jgi:phosphoenolpyruvate synthase/pyruvate phosphate dikinase
MFHYDQFMRDNGLYARLERLMSEPSFQDPALRASALGAFKREVRAAPMRPELVQAVVERAAQLFPGGDLRFRSSTNAEDLGTFTGAGLYDSETGRPELSGDQRDSWSGRSRRSGHRCGTRARTRSASTSP